MAGRLEHGTLVHASIEYGMHVPMPERTRACACTWRHRAHASLTKISTASEADSHLDTISHASCACAVCGVWSVGFGVWFVVCGVWSVVCGVVCGVWCVVCGGDWW